MMQINAEYDYCVEHGTHTWQTPEGKPDTTNTMASMQAYKEIISQLVSMEGLNIELCGTWLWIDGMTIVHKERLKAIGCNWAGKKRKWFWRPDEYKVAKRKAGISMDAIRALYGSVTIEGTPAKKLTA